MFDDNKKNETSSESIETQTRYVATNYAKVVHGDCQCSEKKCNGQEISKTKSIRELLPVQQSDNPQDRSFAKSGGRGRSSEFYTGIKQYEKEIRHIFEHQWLPVEHVSRLKKKGSFITLKFDTINVLVMRGNKGIQAYHNYCTHRGCRLVEEESGRKNKFLCKYHCWQFDSDGQLDAWNGTYLDSSFNPDEASLKKIHTQIRHGIVFISLNSTPTDIDEYLGDFAKFASVYDLESFVCAETRDYPVDCNWKLVLHNINESLHFPATHPSLHKIADYDDAGVYDVQGNIVCSYNRIRKGFNTVSMTGETSREALKGIPEEDKDIINWVTILPNLMFGFCADYILMQWVWPQTESSCLVRNHWLFHKNQVSKSDFSCEDVVNIWLRTNDEDWEICERTQRGIESRYWQPGFLSLDEEVIFKIDQWIANQTDSE